MITQRRKPSPKSLQDRGGFQRTPVHSRGQRIVNKATSWQPATRKSRSPSTGQRFGVARVRLPPPPPPDLLFRCAFLSVTESRPGRQRHQAFLLGEDLVQNLSREGIDVVCPRGLASHPAGST